MTRKMGTVLTGGERGFKATSLTLPFYSLWLAEHVLWAGSFTSVANTSHPSESPASRSRLPAVIACNMNTDVAPPTCIYKTTARTAASLDSGTRFQLFPTLIVSEITIKSWIPL
jgi:hypothetical protein